nr:DUF814 domain-containing protein [Campylobacter sp.]
MKYKVLIQIAEFLNKFKKISIIKRVADTAILIKFDNKFELIFDLNKSGSSIYKANLKGKTYKAPFDIVLQKRFLNAKILSLNVPQNNRILHIRVCLEGSYKKMISNLYLEFTGRFTNAIITDENDVILEALRHFSTEFRQISVGKNLIHLNPCEIKEKPSEQISDFEAFFEDEFLKIQNKKIAQIKTAKIQSIEKKIANLNMHLNSLQSKDELLKQAEICSKKAEVLVANLYKIKDYERKFEIKFNEEIFKFDLKNPAKFEANDLFKLAKKYRQKAKNIAIQSQNLQDKLVFLQNLLKAVLNSNDPEFLENLLPKNTNKKDFKNADIIENFYIGEYKIILGKNEKGNEFLLSNAKKDDFWFHLKDLPSAHVIVKTNKQSLNDEIIKFASRICAEFSVNEKGKYLVDWTKKINVKVVNKAFVNYTNYSTTEVII